ncbi:hypothetical protein ACM9HF_17490 [Colwellia sp. RE-S-Sl-9]
MFFVELSEKIIALTEQVEQLIDNKNEEHCSALLSQRHSLLVELHEKVTQEANKNDTVDIEMMDNYHHFLTTIQQRDNVYLTHLDAAKKEVMKALSLQVVGTKAVSAYKNVIID